VRTPRQGGGALRRLAATGLGAALIAAPGSGCGSDSGGSDEGAAPVKGEQAPPGAVATGDFFFRPAPKRVRAGGRVVWANLGAVPHTVKGPGFSSPSLDPGERFAHTFARPGRYEYVCTLHPTQMSGSIVVGP
jgi:plastocyanin